MWKHADLSEDRKYRYVLARIWEQELHYACFICLNPSTADETEDDPTIRRCVNYAKEWGYGGMVMCNLFAFRATDPKDLKAADAPVGEIVEKFGELNDLNILDYASSAGVVVAAWGTHGSWQARDIAVAGLLKGEVRLNCLKTTKDGHPSHPLYLPKDLEPIPFKVDS